MLSVFAVGAGAAIGAVLRRGLGLALDSLFRTVPLGTLTANLAGGFLLGIAVGLFSALACAPPEARPAITTGFLGGFTTFSTFSAEVVDLLGRQLYGWGPVLVSLHVVGSLLLTVPGLVIAHLVFPGGQS